MLLIEDSILIQNITFKSLQELFSKEYLMPKNEHVCQEIWIFQVSLSVWWIPVFWRSLNLTFQNVLYVSRPEYIVLNYKNLIFILKNKLFVRKSDLLWPTFWWEIVLNIFCCTTIAKTHLMFLHDRIPILNLTIPKLIRIRPNQDSQVWCFHLQKFRRF